MEQRVAKKGNNYARTKAGDLAAHLHQSSDSLARSASDFYFDTKVYQDVLEKLGTGAAKILARQSAIRKAKTQQWYRRTYQRNYCNRSECGNYAYMEGNEFQGRMEPQVVNTYAVGDDWYEKVDALVIHIPHRGERIDGVDFELGTFLAAIRTVDCDGMTVDVSEVYFSPDDAKKAADGMAQRECEVIQESNEQYAQESRIEEINDQLAFLRRETLKLIKHIKPIRCDIPSAIVMCVMDKITDMLTERRDLFDERNQIPG